MRQPLSTATAARLLIGTSGWSYNHWKDLFYLPGLPPADWLSFYAREFRTVEINNSFYRLPTREGFERWAAQAPDDFLFAVKASRLLTHVKRLKDPQEPLRRMLEASAGLREKRGPVLFQLPPNYHRNLDRLAGILRLWPADLRCAWEFRHESWLAEATYDLLAEYGAALCIPDSPKLPEERRVTALFTYIRFHEGRTGTGYTDDELAGWVPFIRSALATGHDVYAYFNNDPGGHAIYDARRLKALLEAG